MTSFGLTIVALAAVVSPGVLFIVSFLTFSIIKRTSISFGPAIDVAVFFSLSLLLNGLYGGVIGWLSLTIYNPCGERLLPEILGVLDQLIRGGGGCSVQSSAGFLYLYLALLCLMSCGAGAGAAFLAEAVPVKLAQGTFATVASVARRGGATICSALCKFGGENSFVIYVGQVQEILLDEKKSISSISITRTRRSLLRIKEDISATELEDIPFVNSEDEFMIPGASIENIALSHIDGDRRCARYAAIAGVGAAILAPIALSFAIYLGMAATTLAIHGAPSGAHH